jgi:tetratricopeptide (TPR) repeat protein
MQVLGAHQAGDLAGAEAGYLAILRSAPHVIDALHLLGLVYQKQGKLFDASALVRAAIRLQPESPVMLANFGSILNDIGRFQDAEITCKLALNLDANSLGAHNNLGNALVSQNRYDEAISHYRAALRIDPSDPHTAGNLANALVAVGDDDGALRTYQAGLSLAPDNPELNHGYASQLLQTGQFAEGFRRYESRWSLPITPRFAQQSPAPQWDGSQDLTGRRILIRAEQGLGDTLQFVRYIPLVAQMASEVWVEVQAPVSKLLAHNFENHARIIVQGEPLPSVDYQCALMSLPLAFQTTPETIPFAREAYLFPSPEDIAVWAEKVPAPTSPRVGFVWNANRVGVPHAKVSSSRRSVPLAAFASLLRTPNITPVILQKEMTAAEASMLAAHGINENHGQMLSSFSDTAALIAQLDLVVTVDTSVAHVAGALGKPVWILVPTAADWRWLRGRDDSVWYPHVRLFRQTTPGDWSPVLKIVEKALSLLKMAAR